MAGEAPIAQTKTSTTPNSTHDAQSQRLAKPWQLSPRGLAFVKMEESGMLNGESLYGRVTDGYILNVYLDSVGLKTVGMGHKVLPEDNLHAGQTISMAKARQLSDQDLGIAVSSINRNVHVPLYQNEVDALVDLIFNTGSGAFARHVAPIINSGIYGRVPDFIRSFRANGNERRREQEANTFATGSYNASH
jgi:lysozyme